MAAVMYESAKAEHDLVGSSNRVRRNAAQAGRSGTGVPIDGIDQALSLMQGTDAVFEPGVVCSREDVPSQTQLMNPPEALQDRRIKHKCLPGLQADRTP